MQRLGRPTRVAGAWTWEGEIALAEGDVVEARACARRALALGHDDHEIRVRAALVLAAAALTEGDAEEARTQVEHGLAAVQEEWRTLVVQLKAIDAAATVVDEARGDPAPAERALGATVEVEALAMWAYGYLRAATGGA